MVSNKAPGLECDILPRCRPDCFTVSFVRRFRIYFVRSTLLAFFGFQLSYLQPRFYRENHIILQPFSGGHIRIQHFSKVDIIRMQHFLCETIRMCCSLIMSTRKKCCSLIWTPYTTPAYSTSSISRFENLPDLG